MISTRYLIGIIISTCWLSAASAEIVAQPQNMSLYTGKDAVTAITEALVRAGAGEDIKVSMNQLHEEDVIASTTGTISGDAENMDLDKAHGQWRAILQLKENGRNLAPIRISGRYDEMVQLPVLKRQIISGEVIRQEDIDMDHEPASRVRKNTVMNAQDIIGKSPKRVISKGRPIRTEEIASPALVNKGTQVTLFFKSNNIEIRTFGEALESGAKGDVIKVRNLSTKTVIQGTVESSSVVRVSSPNTSSAGIM